MHTLCDEIELNAAITAVNSTFANSPGLSLGCRVALGANLILSAAQSLRPQARAQVLDLVADCIDAASFAAKSTVVAERDLLAA